MNFYLFHILYCFFFSFLRVLFRCYFDMSSFFVCNFYDILMSFPYLLLFENYFLIFQYVFSFMLVFENDLIDDFLCTFFVCYFKLCCFFVIRFFIPLTVYNRKFNNVNNEYIISPYFYTIILIVVCQNIGEKKTYLMNEN